MTRMTRELVNAQQGCTALNEVYKALKPELIAGHQFVIKIAPRPRSVAANAMFHAMLAYISKNLEWAGAKRDIETWKRLMIAAWSRASGRPLELLPAIDGSGVDIVFARSSTLSRADFASLCEFMFAWGSVHDVQFPADPHLLASDDE